MGSKESDSPATTARSSLTAAFVVRNQKFGYKWHHPTAKTRQKAQKELQRLKWLKYYKNTGCSVGRTHLRRGQFWPSAFRMASVMLEQPEAHKDCNLWHPLHIVMRPSSVICYKKNNNNITSHNDGGGGARHCIFSFSDSQPGTQRPSCASFNPKTRSNVSAERLEEEKPR